MTPTVEYSVHSSPSYLQLSRRFRQRLASLPEAFKQNTNVSCADRQDIDTGRARRDDTKPEDETATDATLQLPPLPAEGAATTNSRTKGRLETRKARASERASDHVARPYSH